MYKLLIISLILTAATTAQAYELRKTAEGTNIRWSTSEVELVLDSSLVEVAPMSEMERIITAAFSSWTDAGDVPIKFRFVHGTCDEPGYVANSQNSNCIMASSDPSLWQGNQGAETGATTKLTYSPLSGNIQDADIIFNTLDWNWSTGKPVGNELSIYGVLAHEVGHLLGLAHSEIEKAIMFSTTTAGIQSVRTLHNDDIDAVDSLYEGLHAAFEEDLDTDSLGCSITNVSASSNAHSFVPLLILLGLALYRRSRNHFRFIPSPVDKS